MKLNLYNIYLNIHNYAKVPNCSLSFCVFQRISSGHTLEETHLGVTYDEDKTPLFVIECSGHALNYIVYVMLLTGAMTRRSPYLIPFVAHCIAGISLFLGFTEATFFLGLQCFKECTWGNCKFTLLSLLSIIMLVCECVFLTYSRKFYLEIKKTDPSQDNEQAEQEEGLLQYKTANANQ